jgi:spermidine synthase
VKAGEQHYFAEDRADPAEWPSDAVAQILFEAQSLWQHILLSKDRTGQLVMTLDGVWQFHGNDEHIYHDVLVHPAMLHAPRVDDVLILGGGDGLALRDVLRYPVKRAVLCELDAEVIRMTRAVPEMRELTRRSFDDPRSTVLIQDALEYLPATDQRFDVVISDFPASTREELNVLFTPATFRKMAGVLRDDGVLAVQVSQQPAEFWNIYGHLAQLFPWAVPMLVEMGTGEGGEVYWANYVVASRQPRCLERALPEGTRFLTVDKLSSLQIRNFSLNDFRTELRPGGVPLHVAWGKGGR